jgi:hypothetical protein
MINLLCVSKNKLYKKTENMGVLERARERERDTIRN